jgi:hypothetical protein
VKEKKSGSWFYYPEEFPRGEKPGRAKGFKRN